MVTGRKSQISHLRKGVVSHSSIDNNDGGQETVTGSGTTYDTNKTLFQNPAKDTLLKPTIGDEVDDFRELLSYTEPRENMEHAPYKPGNRVGPQLFPTYEDDTSQDEINFLVYLDFLLDASEDLELPYIFVHSDEAIYSKLCDISWLNKELYQNIISMMGGFHQVRVMQKLIYKRYYCRDMENWCVDAAVIAKGSADQAIIIDVLGCIKNVLMH